MKQLPEIGQSFDRLAEAPRQPGFLEQGKHLADLAQLGHRISAHSQGDALCGAKEIAEQWHAKAFRPFKQQRRTASPKRPPAHFCDLQAGVDRLRDPPQRAAAL